MKVTQGESGNNETVLRGKQTCCVDVQGLIKKKNEKQLVFPDPYQKTRKHCF